MPYSIQRRIVFRILAGVFVLLASLAFLSELFIVDFLEKQHDESLLTKANLLVTMTKFSHDAEHENNIDFDFADEFMPEFGGENENEGKGIETEFVQPFTSHVPVEYFQLWLDSGEVFERSNSLKGADLSINIDQQDSHSFADVILTDGRRGRLIQVTFYPQIPEDEDRTAQNYAKLPRMHLIVATEIESLEALKRFIYVGFILVVLIFTLLSYFVVNFSVKSAMQPIQQLRDQLHRLEARKLSQRIQVNSPPEELIDVVMQCNLLLERIEKSFVREQRFNADVAHELRTPISELRSLADLAEKWPEDQEIIDDCCRGAKDVAIKMELIVNRLLSLARYEDSSKTLVLEEINVHESVVEVWPHLESKALAKSLKLNIDIAPSAKVFVSKTEWQLLVTNLLSNAVSYCTDHTAINVVFSTQKNKGTFSVSNITEQLTEQDLAYIFQRFWRQDKSRNSSENSGLGLSLVRALAQRHHFDVHATLNDGIFQITVKNIQVQLQSAKK